MDTNEVVLDFQTHKGLKASLKYFLNDNFCEFIDLLHKEWIKNCCNIKNIFWKSELEKKIDIDWDKVSLKNISVKIFHFTTRKQDEWVDSIYNLSFLLSNKTDFRDFFKRHGLRIDIENHLLFLKGDIINLNNENIPNKFQKLRTKIYDECEIWGFLRIKDFYEYNHQFPSRPEFVSNVELLLDDASEMLTDWEQSYGVPYVIEFLKPLDSIKTCTGLITNKKQYIEDNGLTKWDLRSEIEVKKCELEIKKALFTLLIESYIINLEKEGRELIAVLPKGENVCSNQITKVWEFSTFKEKILDY